MYPSVNVKNSCQIPEDVEDSIHGKAIPSSDERKPSAGTVDPITCKELFATVLEVWERLRRTIKAYILNEGKPIPFCNKREQSPGTINTLTWNWYPISVVEMRGTGAKDRRGMYFRGW
jgi:hypothetical protein